MHNYIVTIEVTEGGPGRRLVNAPENPKKTRMRSRQTAPSEEMAKRMAENLTGGVAIYCELEKEK